MCVYPQKYDLGLQIMGRSERNHIPIYIRMYMNCCSKEIYEAIEIDTFDLIC